ncbi:CarD family transcriptional regulator [Neobacillus niacini]|uniref:CarD family transcriptional regulator n=1 Tax=Neobacillus niacini TaxID=86668 RepID=UPI0028638A28|nr:CarD family transcriptional regulator [Neobacillus niacini]MDR7077448.1 CarD family transcriptional regulator [Neobacillus niacini]
MFNVGDLIIYSSLGICRIDNICEQTYNGTTRKYYVIQPVEDKNLTIHNPVDNDQVVMLGMINREDALEILESFKEKGIRWIDKGHDRTKEYTDIVKTGNRKEISRIINTLMRKKFDADRNGKKLGDPDRRLLSSIQNILFKELAIALNTSFESIFEKTTRYIQVKN